MKIYGCSAHGYESTGKMGLQLHMNGAGQSCVLYLKDVEEVDEKGSNTGA